MYCGNIYDDYGKYRGRIDSSGNIYDDCGKYKGRIDSSGNIYDDCGKYKGRIDSSGNIYDDCGKIKGRIDNSGNIYDDYGKNKGRTDSNGNRMGNTGNFSNTATGQNLINEAIASAESLGCGTIIAIIIFAALSIGVLCISGEQLLTILLTPPLVYVFLVIALVTGIIGLCYKENELKKIFCTNYVLYIILWILIMVLSDYSDLRSLEIVVYLIITAGCGLILMAFISLFATGISFGVTELFRFLHKKHKARYLVGAIVITIAMILIANRDIIADEIIDVSEDTVYEEGIDAFEEEDYLYAMECFMEDIDHEGANEYLEKATIEYLRGFWRDVEEEWTALGYGFVDDKFLVWHYATDGLINTKSGLVYDYEYEIKGWTIYEEDGEIVIQMCVDNNGKDGYLTFRNLTEETLYCDEEGSYERYK